ncbi:MAG: peptidase, partial [Lachnospiraceae bacterium]|nr:peptidase [Lachnospiraceae bacterium]
MSKEVKSDSSGFRKDKNDFLEGSGKGGGDSGQKKKKRQPKRVKEKPSATQEQPSDNLSESSAGENTKQHEEKKAEQFSEDKRDDTEQGSSDGYRRKNTYYRSDGVGGRKKKKKEQTHTNDFKAENLFSDGGDSSARGSEKLERLRKKSEKAGQRYEKAHAKLPKQTDYRWERVFDEKTGKGKNILVPVVRDKDFRGQEQLKGMSRRLQNEGSNFVHGKVAEHEKENSGVEAAHKTEQTAERVFDFVIDHHKPKHQRDREKVQKLEQKKIKADTDFLYQKYVEEHPEVQKKAVQKRMQKQRIKQDYIKAYRNKGTSKTAQGMATKTKDAAVAVFKKAQELVGRNITVIAMVLIFFMLIMFIMTAFSSCGAMFADTSTTVMVSSYFSKPEDIDAAELEFTNMEMQLQTEINNIETENPDYDEYSYELGAIGHSP